MFDMFKRVFDDDIRSTAHCNCFQVDLAIVVDVVDINNMPS
jgi:hypothetical protein